MFPMTITLTNTKQLNAVLAAMNLATESRSTTQDAVVDAQPVATVKTKKETATEVPSGTSSTQVSKSHLPPAEAAAPEPTPEPAPVAVTPVVEGDTTLTYPEVSKVVNAAATRVSRAAAAKCLATFGGATNLKQVDPSQFAAVVAAMNALGA